MLSNIERAIMVAEKAHANQTYDVYPYTYHTKAVADIATTLGYDESIIIACHLHDTIEDTDLSYNDIKKAFGGEVAEIVYAVTDELGRNRKERKTKTLPKIRANWKATVVKICDRIANVTQSKMYNDNLYNMYKKEHADFCSGITCPSHPAETNRAWDLLNDMLNLD
jgi:(p)ppGpp synthase/HD superfamily hydrolase